MKTRDGTRVAKKPRIRVRAPRGSIALHYGKFRAEVTIDGSRARKTFDAEEDAQRFLEDCCRRSLRFGISLDKGKVTVAEWLQLFFEAKQARNLKQSTIANYRVEIRHINEVLGSVPVCQLEEFHITRLLSHLRTKKGFSSKYTYGIYAMLSDALKLAVRRRIVERNVVKDVDPPKVKSPPMKIMPESELDRFLGAIDDPRDRALFYILLSTGLRRGELIGLKWTDLDWESGRITVQRRITQDREQKGYDIDTPKSDAGFRVVMLPPPVMEVLAAWQERQNLERQFYRAWQEGGWLLTSRKHQRAGRHLDPRAVNLLLDNILTRSELPHLTVHQLRHTFATWLLSKNASVKDVQQVLGHARASVTLNMYWQAIPGAEGRVADQAAKLFPRGKIRNFPAVSPTGRSDRARLRSIRRVVGS